MNLLSNKKTLSRELLIEVNNLGIIEKITLNCFDMLGYTQSEILNTDISKYLNCTFEDLILNENFDIEFLKKDGTKLFITRN